jgi:hypothetical protein
MVGHLRNLKAINTKIEAASVVSADGQIMASTFPTDMDEARVVYLSATLLSASEQLMSELKSSGLHRITLEGDNKLLVLSAVGEDAILAVLARSAANLERLFQDMRSTIDDLVRLL